MGDHKFSFDGRVRFSETDSSLHLSVNALINYFQDCSALHAEDLGIGFHYLVPQSLAWILAGWQIEIFRMPSFGDPVRVTTWAYAFRSFFGDRNYTLTSPEGEVYARAYGIWVLMNRNTGHPERVSSEMIGIYGLEEKLEMPYRSRKIAVPAGGKSGEPVHIGKSFLDTNGHVNNSRYIDIASSCLPEGYRIRGLRTEYRMQATLGDVIVPSVSEGEDTIVITLGNETGRPFAVVEFSGDLREKGDS